MIKVAGYCRVSTDKEDQANSFESQQRYFTDYIQNQPDWALFRIYADEGITGTSTKKRTQFNRMMHDAYEGCFQMIITKEVSRFSRNILDTIAYTRELRAMGIGVIFANDRINTMEPEAEMLLSFLASLAQEESRRTSSRVVWGQTRQMEKGIVFGRSLLGYHVNGGMMTINEEEAQIVRLIFHQYALEQVSTAQIARSLTASGYRTHGGNTQWTSTGIHKILRNEKYVGDLIQKKSYTPDFLSHEKCSNRGAVPFVAISDHHAPIITRELWNLTQERLQKNDRHSGASGHSNRYPFSGKIKCGVCGSSFVGRFKYRKDGTKYRRWSCARAATGGKSGCDVGRLVRDDDAIQMLKTALRAIALDVPSIVQNVTNMAVSAIQAGERSTHTDPQQIQSEIRRLQVKKESVLDSYFSREISREDMLTMTRKYTLRLEALEQAHAKLNSADPQDRNALRDAIRSELESVINGNSESEVFCKNVLESLTVFQDRHMELRLRYLPHMFRFE